ncbi:MAG: hypothetical protein HDR72_06820 [Ruminococcaceae bacterium]|nr:hypothetical protein [Oscillospiraceae bacterium]
MVNFKTRLGISVILSAMLLSGCQTNADSPQSESSNVSTAQSAESTYDSNTVSDTPEIESSDVSSEQSEESSGFSLEEEPPPFENPYYAGRVYPDDELVPSEWIRVDNDAEVMEKVDEIIKSDTSAKDPESALPALINKNVLIYGIFFGTKGLFDINWDAPYNSADYEYPIYPITSEFFPDVQSINDLVYDTYEHSEADKHLYRDGEPLFTEVNGQVYIYNRRFPLVGGPSAFLARSYAEITEKTENKCTFIWHYPDTEMLNEPESGYEFHYYEKTYTAEYIDGSWKLNKIVNNL